jgi:serine/threonine protein kinase
VADAGGQSRLLTTVAPEPGDVIEDYEILEKIGGNMGLVFKARHRLLDKIVALKFLPADFITDPARLARFERELRVMGQLEHSNLVTAADARIVAHWHLVAMEWIDGVDLQQLVRSRGPLPVDVSCEVARQAALGLQHAHQHGLIHRDIKPSNLMLTRTGVIKVIDMGLALTREDSTAPLTQTGLVLGTMSYCAPEQFRDASKVDIRADIYSLGCTLYHLLTGKSPYWQRKTFAEVVQAHLHEPFPSLLEALPDAPATLDTVLAQMTAKDPAARFATPSKVVEALEPFTRGTDLKSLVPPAPQQSLPLRATPAKASPSPDARRPAAGGEQRPKGRWMRRAALLLLPLAIASAIFLATKRAPVVVLMDTTAPNGVYDYDNKTGGASNAKELYKVLSQDGFLPPSSLRPEPLFADWAREDSVCSQRPDLVIIHRSSFFHSYNAEFQFGLPPEFAHPSDDPRWRFLYSFLGDEKLKTLIGIIGNEVPQSRFLVYSRGTDTNWLSASFRADWVNKAEVRFPKLKGRIYTMVIPNYYNGTFRDPETARQLRQQVKAILGLPEKRN